MSVPTCQQCRDFDISAQQRVAMGCGYLEPDKDRDGVPIAPNSVWKHEGDRTNPTVCSGFTVELPDVIDVALSHRHWSKGQLGVVLGGDGVCQALADGLLMLDGAVQEHDGWVASGRGKKP